jgi:hypothetical protein
MTTTAQAGEARRAETHSGSVADEHAVAEGDAPTPRYEGQERRLTRRLSDPVRTLAEAFPEFYEALKTLKGVAEALPHQRQYEGPLAFALDKARDVLRRMEGRKE